MNKKPDIDAFCSGVELGKCLGSTDVIPNAYDAILNTSPTYKLHTNLSGFNVLAFNCSPDYTTRFLNREFGLVSSENLKVVDFISRFKINEAAVRLFDEHLFVELSKLKDQLIYKPLVVTGRSLGGYIAHLFTLWLQHVVDVEESNGKKGTKRPICITFGSPLVGDEILQKAIFKRPQWKSCFLNVVAKMDPVPFFLLSNGAYKPFGTYLFCTESGGFASFEDHDTILEILDTMAAPLGAGNLMHDYRNDLSSMKRKVLYRGVSELGDFNFNLLKSGITLQLLEVGVVDTLDNGDSRALIEKLDSKEAKMVRRKKSVYEPARKLNDMKISLARMEWYMKNERVNGGYYDSFKNDEKSREDIEGQQKIIFHQRRLNQYWKEFVEEKDRMPQKEGAKLRKRWLHGGTNYRRIVEPLDIAEHYKKGNINYVTKRANHYKLLEKLLTEDKLDSVPIDGRNKAASLTEDSCFWAHVEEALIWLRDLKDGGSSSNSAEVEGQLEKFDAYVMGLIDDYTVSPDIFLDRSSFMKWWSEYKAYKGSSYDSPLARFMNKEGYNSYK